MQKTQHERNADPYAARVRSVTVESTKSRVKARSEKDEGKQALAKQDSKG